MTATPISDMKSLLFDGVSVFHIQCVKGLTPICTDEYRLEITANSDTDNGFSASGPVDLSQCGIKTAITVICLVHRESVAWFYGGGDTDGSGAGGFNRRPRIDAGSGEERSTECSAFLGFEH